jgi:hypothetical protein
MEEKARKLLVTSDQRTVVVHGLTRSRAVYCPQCTLPQRSVSPFLSSRPVKMHIPDTSRKYTPEEKQQLLQNLDIEGASRLISLLLH